MNKTILIASLVGGAALSTIASRAEAQSSVTIYGQLEQTAARANTDGPVKSHLTQINPSSSGSSLWGFRGSEDLGSGLSAIFALEGALAPDTGGAGNASAPSGPNASVGSFFNRLSYVGLRSEQLGTVKLGRSFTPTIQALLNANVIRPSYNTGLTTTVTSQGLANDFYSSNMVRYETPTFAGLSVLGHVSAGEVPAGGKGGKTYGLAANYVNSFLTFTAAHHVDRDTTDSQISWDAATVAAEFGSLKIAAGADRVRVPISFQSAAPSTYRDSKMRMLGVAYRVADLLTLSAQYSDVKYTATQSSSQQRVFSANYNLSRRTAVFLLASSVSSGPVGIAAMNGFAAVANASVTAYGLGVNHIF